jgi:hypothetical protein
MVNQCFEDNYCIHSMQGIVIIRDQIKLSNINNMYIRDVLSSIILFHTLTKAKYMSQIICN